MVRSTSPWPFSALPIPDWGDDGAGSGEVGGAERAHSVSAVSIGPLAKTPHLPSSTGAADYTIESGAAAAAPAPN
jgi:hypothetical protein